VPSPRPKRVLEMQSIKNLVKMGRGVISGGGGGIPLYRSREKLIGVDAVIDKDLTTQLIASAINADTLIILTNVDYVYEKLGSKDSAIKSIKASELKKELRVFEEGTMKPKIDACIRFIENGGSKAYIGNLFKFGDVLKGRSGTEIY
jgi:carbamate kinase